MKNVCPLCGTENEKDARFCKECNEPLYNPTDNKKDKEINRKDQIQENNQGKTSSIDNQPPKFYKNPSVSTILSFFFMGLGQIYNGQIGKGILFIILYGISVVLMSVIIGFITTPILWIWGMVDANNSAKKINEKLAKE
jgi:TM2 domain-containing membrane protein YozV